MPTLEERLVRLEDVEEIRRMRTEELLIWDQAVNAGLQPDFDAMTQQYTDDAVIDVGVFGSFIGREAIREYLATSSASVDT